MTTGPNDAFFAPLQNTNQFPQSSRYHNIETALFTRGDTAPVAYLRRRFLPAAGARTSIGQYGVKQDDRRDILGSQFFGSPQNWWLLADQNGVFDPEELTAQPGQNLSVPAVE